MCTWHFRTGPTIPAIPVPAISTVPFVPFNHPGHLGRPNHPRNPKHSHAIQHHRRPTIRTVPTASAIPMLIDDADPYSEVLIPDDPWRWSRSTDSNIEFTRFFWACTEKPSKARQSSPSLSLYLSLATSLSVGLSDSLGSLLRLLLSSLLAAKVSACSSLFIEI